MHSLWPCFMFLMQRLMHEGQHPELKYQLNQQYRGTVLEILIPTNDSVHTSSLIQLCLWLDEHKFRNRVLCVGSEHRTPDLYWVEVLTVGSYFVWDRDLYLPVLKFYKIVQSKQILNQFLLPIKQTKIMVQACQHAEGEKKNILPELRFPSIAVFWKHM